MRWLHRLAALALLLACSTCDTVGFLDLCDPKEGERRVSFYSSGDCLGTNMSVFRGHEWVTLLGNRDSDAPGGQIFTDDQIDHVIEGNRHKDYPKELLVHIDQGPTAYLDALFAYHNDQVHGQIEHFILRSNNTYEESRVESLGVLRALTHEAAENWPDHQVESLTALGKATHLLQDSFSPAHSVRVPDPPAPDVPWCFCKIKTYVPRSPGYDWPDIEFHDRLDDRADDRGKVHTTALDSIYVSDRYLTEGGKTYDCLDPQDANTVEHCMKPEAKRAELATREYLRMVRRMLVTGADAATIDAELDAHIAVHYVFCSPTVPLGDGRNCDRTVSP